ncbi:hypothetical protein D3C71_2146850 [compost metagenome]
METEEATCLMEAFNNAFEMLNDVKDEEPSSLRIEGNSDASMPHNRICDFPDVMISFNPSRISKLIHSSLHFRTIS